MLTNRNAFVFLFAVASLMLAACATTGAQVTPQQPVAEVSSPPPQASASNEDSQLADSTTAPSDQKPCFSGRFIVADDGRIEMEGCPTEMEVFIPGGAGNADPPDSNYLVGRSIIKVPNPTESQLLLGPNDQGRYYIPGEYESMEKAPYLTLVDGTPTLVAVDCECGTVQSKALFPALEVNPVVRYDRKLTPFMMPDIMGPPAMEITGNVRGQIIEGRAFSVLSPRAQMAYLFAVPGRDSGGDQE